MKTASFLLAAITIIGLSSVPQSVASSEETVYFCPNKAYFYNFYSVCPLPSGEVWAVGSHGMICAFADEVDKWVVQDSGTDANLYRVLFASPQKGWIVGQSGLILHSDDGGGSWARQESGVEEHLFGLSFPDQENGWAVGAYGTILHTSNGGKTWSRQGEKIDRIYNAVYFVDADHGWVVGEFGTILRTDDGGRTWLSAANPYGEKTLFSVFFLDGHRGWATGMDGCIIATSDGGANWTKVDSPVKEHLFDLEGIGQSLWTVGFKGVYAMGQPGELANATSLMPTRAWLKQCAFVNPSVGWVVGSVGTLLHTKDGGKTWKPAWGLTSTLD